MNKDFLELKDVSYQVGLKNILSNITFSLKKGEILTIVGPSGSGKSSILKIIAGLIKPSNGSITFLKNLLSSNKVLIPTGERKIGLMFQEDVLFPHYTVYENIEFGILNKEKNNRKKIVSKLLSVFKLNDVADLYPDKLSGGEKQRVALARILITRPKILLMDEPFSSLDYNLGKEISEFTIKLLKENKISVIFVTHDIKSAFRVSDKMLIIKKGKIIQNDTPENIYNKPSDRFIAEFVGEANKIEAKINKSGEILTPFGKINCLDCKNSQQECNSKKHFILIRPEDVNFVKNGLKCKVVDKFFLGDIWEYKVLIKKTLPALKVRTSNSDVKINEFVGLSINTKKILVFSK
ncbi:MAG: hypothetical protein CMJ08_02640 [Pelagibacterales bacterium]|nr:hypothetical protein [Pelagibacterales bacterium]|tara:strand:+ start:5929 stop:6981 length:1053 start_codon:yes stop_codon:yes gene_type:complete